MPIQLIENIIIATEDGEIDFQALGYKLQIVNATKEAITYKHPVSNNVYTAPCEYHAGAALITTY